jgi:acyl phosphate:glycerol-3-phosphate acyltransferase
MKGADMIDALLIFKALAVAYVIGATPFGYMAGKWRGIDIRDHGSGNIGATNVIRVLGKGIGIPVFILDFCKGLGPVLLMDATYDHHAGAKIAAAMGAVLGHNFTFWLGYKGGKGVATSAGALMGLIPVPTCIVIATWMVVFFATRYVAVASIAAGVALPVAAWWQVGISPIFWFTIALSSLVIWRHRSNIQRLRAGTENRFTRKGKAPTAPGDAVETATEAEEEPS